MVIFLIIVCFSSISCSLWPQNNYDKLPTYTVGVVLKAMDSEHWLAVKSGMEQAAQKYNMNVIILCPANESAVAEQKKIIFDLLQKKIDALLVAPCDVTASADYIEMARQRDIPIFTLDEKIDNIPYIGSDNFYVGSLAAQELLRQMGDSTTGKIAVLCGNERQNAHIQRVAGFENYLEKHAPYSIAVEKYADSSFEKAYRETKVIMTQMPEIDGIFVTSGVMGVGCVQALEDMQIKKKVHIVGVDTQDDFILEIRQGKVDAIVSQNGSDIGTLAIKTVADALENKVYQENSYITNTLITTKNVNAYLSP